MAFTVVSPESFIDNGMFREEEFLARTGSHDWEQYRGKNVLVRGCGEVIVPPWAFMVLAARLGNVARSVRYGNEHDNVVVHRHKS